MSDFEKDELDFFGSLDLENVPEDAFAHPNGTWEMHVFEAALTRSKKGNTGLTFLLKSEVGEIQKWLTMPSPNSTEAEKIKSLRWVRAWLNSLEIPADYHSTVIRNIVSGDASDVVGIGVLAEISKSGDYQNIFVQSVIHSDGTRVGAAQAEAIATASTGGDASSMFD